jgi:antitoxin (DNA-binding transcriptional repressor) of toxin-antitoxin stability system
MDDGFLTAAAASHAGTGRPASPAKQVRVRQFRAKLAMYRDAAANGGRIEVLSRGRVVAQLCPPAAPPTRASTRGALKGQFRFAPDWLLPSDELADLFEHCVI